MPTTPDPKKAKLEADINALNKKISDLKTAQVVVKNPNEETYFKLNTDKTKVADATISQFADVYKPLYDQYRGVNMATGNVAGRPGEKAFFTFDAVTEATRGADQKIAEQTDAKAKYTAQQEAIKQWIASMQSTDNEQIYKTYFDEQMKAKNPYLQQGYVTSNDILFNKAIYDKSKDRKSVYTPGRGNIRNYIQPTSLLMYKDESATKQMSNALDTQYRQVFNNDPTLQAKYRDAYVNSLTKDLLAKQKEYKKLK
jgi:hypothetical protein